MGNIFIGTELKLNINIKPIGQVTMDDYDFEVEVYGPSKIPVIIPKSKAIRVDNSNYIVLVDTNTTKTGALKCKVKALIPDEDFHDKLRTEIVCIDTGINVIKI